MARKRCGFSSWFEAGRTIHESHVSMSLSEVILFMLNTDAKRIGFVMVKLDFCLSIRLLYGIQLLYVFHNPSIRESHTSRSVSIPSKLPCALYAVPRRLSTDSDPSLVIS